MRACPRCGNPNPDGAAACGACGAVLDPDAVRPPVAAPSLKQTMLGISPRSVPAERPVPKAEPPPNLSSAVPLARAGTLLGMQSPFGAAAPATAEPDPPPQLSASTLAAVPGKAAGNLKQTMLGYAAPGVSGAPRASPPVAHPAATPSTQTPPPGNLGGTLVYANQPPADAGPEPGPPEAMQPGPPRGLNYQQTMLGVARPGIAPLQPGKPVKAFVPNARPAEPPRPVAAPVAPNSGLVSNAKPLKRGRPRGAMVLIGVAGALAVTAGVVAFLWEAPRPMRAEVILDDRGNEALALTCDDCVDGTVVSIAAAKATFTGKKAQLSLVKPLDVGSNKQVVSVHRPGIGRDEEVVLTVAIDYRVRGVLTSLAEDPPKLKVAVQATPGAAAVVDGKPVTLDGTGKGEYSLDVSKELEGPADTILPFEKKLPYVITPSGGEPKTGEVTLRFGIVPLRVYAPGDSIVLEGETFMLSGRTLTDGRITVAGRPITVDAEGRFAQLMNVSSVGETTIVVRAESKDHAPRLVRARVKRVTSLRDEASTFRQSAVSDYATIAADPRKGEAVVLDGEVMEARLDGEETVLLLDAKKGCAEQPCLARIVYGGRFDTKKGATISAYGRAHGSVDGPRTGRQIPEIFAEFLQKSKP
jgi:hypothetical protein